ncbi:MAG: VOC family protein [Acidobacteria bacterium]|nr:VOC family protein [Acidobacteriota bacterium]
MKRMHIHVSVADLDNSIRFYSTLFGQQPTRTEGDYAKWQLENPRVNFAISNRENTPGLNHLSIQVENDDELVEMHERLAQLSAPSVEEKDAQCCYAQSNKYWTQDPNGLIWETFHTLGTVPVFGSSKKDAACCVPNPAKSSGCCA